MTRSPAYAGVEADLLLDPLRRRRVLPLDARIERSGVVREHLAKVREGGVGDRLLTGEIAQLPANRFERLGQVGMRS